MHSPCYASRELKPRFTLSQTHCFRVDLGLRDVNVSLLIGNTLFRSGDDGRKDKPEQLLRDAVPPSMFHAMQLPTQHRFGVVFTYRRSTRSSEALPIL